MKKESIPGMLSFFMASATLGKFLAALSIVWAVSVFSFPHFDFGTSDRA